jgi:4-amino-4-deoxy-L-arabinose transferase-like glycosyltransferase
MVRTSDYVTPRFLGEPFLDKPILFFWAEALSLRLFGMNEAAVRIPPLLFGVLGMIAVAQLGLALFDANTGLIAGIVYGTMMLPLGVSEVAVHDVAIVPFMCAAIVLLMRAGETGALGSAIGAGVCLGLSILTKGLVGIAFAGLFAIGFAAARPAVTMRLAIALTIAIVAAIVVAAPWYLAMERAHPGYLHYYFVERHLQGYLTATQQHAGRHWWYYAPIVAGGSLPWTGYLVAAARTAHADRRRLIVWGWFAAGFVFLSAGESKLATYALPLFPALAILAGEAIASVDGAIDRIGYGVYAATLTVIPIGAIIALQMKFGGMGTGYWILGAATTLTVAFVSLPRTPGISSRSGLRSLRPFTGAAPLPSLIVLMGLMIAVPAAASWMTSREAALELNSGGRLPPHVLVVEERIGSLIFYLDPPLRVAATPDTVDRASMAEAIQRSRAEPLDGVVIVRNNLLDRFERQFAVPPAPAGTAGTNTIFRVESLQKALQGIR